MTVNRFAMNSQDCPETKGCIPLSAHREFSASNIKFLALTNLTLGQLLPHIPYHLLLYGKLRERVVYAANSVF